MSATPSPQKTRPAIAALLHDHRITTKVMLPILLLALVALGVGGMIGSSLKQLDEHYSALLEREAIAAVYVSRLNTQTVDLGRTTWRQVAIPEPEAIRAAIASIEAMLPEVTRRIAIVRPAVLGTPREADLVTLEREFPVLAAAAIRGLRLLLDGKEAEAKALLRAEFYGQIVDLRRANQRLVTALVEAAQQRSAALTAEGKAAQREAAIVGGSLVLLGLALSIWLLRSSITGPLRRLDGAMARLAQGDTTTAIEGTERKDEIGGMARALEGFAAGLRETQALRDAQEAQKQRAEADRRATLTGTADMLEAGVREVMDGIASAATELNAASTSMVAIAEGTSTRATTVGVESNAATGEVNTVAAATEQLAASVNEISRQIASSARMAAGAVEQSQRTNATVAALTEASDRISEVTRLIGEIAGQTNLLALNATIEAARAGDAGKGFAVVASEVKALAGQTAQATVNIAQQIEAMQAATRDATTDIGAIRDSIGQINEMTTAIAAAVEQQGTATREIAESVQRAATGTSRIGEAIQGVSEAASETGGAASQVQATSATLSGQAEALRTAVDQVLHRLRAA